ncbi:MAG: nucleoside-diphosphate sugar epimerase/dehydratase [Ginsengibacter sp.]
MKQTPVMMIGNIPNTLINYFYTVIKNRPTVPRWIIFILDLFICIFALLYAYILRFNMDFTSINQYGLLVAIIVVTGLNIIFFRIFRTYEGIIRLSSSDEGARCVAAVFSTSLVILISIVSSAMVNLPYLVPASVLIIYFFTASFLIFAYRIWIKELYHKSLKAKFTAENVVVFGDTKNGALLKKAIESIAGHQYKVVAFVDIDEKFWGKSIDTIKIYSWEQVAPVVIKLNVKILFLASADLSIDFKNVIVDYCLDNNINIKVIPAIQKWMDGQLQTKQIKSLKIEDLLNRPSIKLAPGHIQQYLTGKRVMITGAAGSIGSEIVKQLAAIPVELLILCDNRETGLYDLNYQLQQTAGYNKNFIVRISDVRNKEVMEDLFITYKPQVVFHAAAYKHVPLMEMHPCEAVLNNVMGTKIVANLSVVYGVERFVFISTDKAINPTNIMGASKRIAEMHVSELQHKQHSMQRDALGSFNPGDEKDIFYRKGNTKFITTRFGTVLGSNGSVIPRFQEQIDNGGPVTVTHAEITRYFMTIPEACSLVLEAGTMGNGGEIFVFDMGEPVKIADLANKMIKLAGLVPGKDIHVKFTGLRTGEKLYEELLSKSEEVIPTHHKKIMISRVNRAEILTMTPHVDHLIELALQNKNIPVVTQMKLMVREFKSQNSVYEKLDTGSKIDHVGVSIFS